MKTPKPFRSAKAAGFTLIEVLVTFTIIVVLATLAALLTKKLRSSADSTTAMKRISAYAQANSLYATDNGGKYVPAYSFDEDGAAGIPWHFNPTFLQALIGDTLDIEDAEEFEGKDGLPEQILDPIVVRAKKRYWSRVSASFAYNNENLPGGGWGQPGTSRAHTIHSVRNPSESFAFITATDWIANYGGRYLWLKSPQEGKSNDSKIAYRHQGKAVAAFYDGHTEIISVEDMKRFDRFGGMANVFWGGTRRSGGR
jgi:prepilin-type N-terminal cleavage/methylation domain-containing protein/prepilin-type processing-associated H-X9-DG protein